MNKAISIIILLIAVAIIVVLVVTNKNGGDVTPGNGTTTESEVEDQGATVIDAEAEVTVDGEAMEDKDHGDAMQDEN